MKKLLLLLFVSMMSISSFAQDRENDALYYLETESKKIKRARFWKQNDVGKWVSSSNRQAMYPNKHYNNNFVYLYTGIFNYMDSNHFILFRKYYSGEYRYPNAELEWYYTVYTEGVYIDNDQLYNLKNIKQNEIIKIRTSIVISQKTSITGNETEFQMSKLLKEFTLLYELNFLQKLLKEPIIEPTLEYVVKYTTSDGEDVIRFRLASSFGLDENEDCSEAYFEIPKKKFDELFIQEHEDKEDVDDLYY